MFETKVLVVNKDASFVDLCAQALAENNIRLTYCEYDSAKIISMILTQDPNFVVIDDFNFDVNARDILACINSSSLVKKPLFLVVMNLDNEYLRQDFKNAGAFSFLENPLTLQSLTDGLLHFSQLLQTMHESYAGGNSFLESAITEVIHKLGVPANIKGYDYLREAILLSVENLEYLHSVTKLLYPAVAERFNTTSSRVERAIRHSIELTWSRGNADAIHVFFGYRPGSRQKPTNSEFIAKISDGLRIKKKYSI